MSKLNSDVAKVRLKKLIDSKCGGSQQKFAELCGVRKNSVSQWVNGITAPGNLSAVKISRVFGVEPLWVMGEPDAPMYKSNVKQTVEMTEHEEDILHKYRSLPPHIRSMVDNTINTLFESLQKGDEND